MIKKITKIKVKMAQTKKSLRSARTTAKQKVAYSRLSSPASFSLFFKKPTTLLGIMAVTVVGSYLLVRSFAASSALPVSAVAASTHDGNVPTNVIDGKLSTRWSAQGDRQWIRFDLGSQKTIDLMRVAFYKGNERINKFDVQISSNGTTWTNLLTNATSSGKSTSLETFNVANTSARYVRYLGHGNSKSAW
ncbi:MAG TPA: discoidin domain-containing protein, partial [Candidatus Saccharimonadales bacterium]|nr:discoidin domain-containing protein [Candidatus Saccharimonadales bacterium]